MAAGVGLSGGASRRAGLSTAAVSVAVCRQLQEDRAGGALRGLHGAELPVSGASAAAGPGGHRGWAVPARGAPSTASLPVRRAGNASVLVRFRLHFLLPALGSLDLGRERELLQQGLRARLQGHGLPLAAHGTIVSAELTGK